MSGHLSFTVTSFDTFVFGVAERERGDPIHVKRRSYLFPLVVTCYPLGGGEGYLTKFNTGRLLPEVQPLTVLHTIWAEKVPLLYTFY